MEKAIEELLAYVNEGIEFCRHSKNQIEIRRIDDFGPSRVNPEFIEESLVARAVAIAAGIILLYINEL